MWELDCEESWALKNWCFWTVVLEKTLESPLDCKEVQSVHPKGDQSWVFIGRTDAEAETPILWLFHEKNWLIEKDSDAGKDWGQEEKGTTEDEMPGCHYQLDGQEFEWTPGVGDGQGGLVCWDSWGRKDSDTTERLNWTELTVLEIMRPSWLKSQVFTVHCEVFSLALFRLCLFACPQMVASTSFSLLWNLDLPSLLKSALTNVKILGLNCVIYYIIAGLKQTLEKKEFGWENKWAAVGMIQRCGCREHVDGRRGVGYRLQGWDRCLV